MKFSKIFTGAASLLLFSSLSAQNVSPLDRIIDRQEEQKNYPDLFNTEKIHEANILRIYNDLGNYGHLVPMSQQDRQMKFNEMKDPNNLKNIFRFIQYTPRNTYARYVKEDPALLLMGFGPLNEVQANISEKVKLAVANGIAVKDVQFQTRDGIELTKFDFIYDESDPKHKPIGSRRKSLTLFYKAGGAQGADTKQKYTLDFVVSRVVDDNFYTGEKDIELIIDPTPLDEQMEDVVILHRHGMKEMNTIPLGLMQNTPNYPHRLMLKQRFLSKVLDDFYRLYTMLDNYAKRDGNDYNDKVILELHNQMDY